MVIRTNYLGYNEVRNFGYDNNSFSVTVKSDILQLLNKIQFKFTHKGYVPFLKGFFLRKIVSNNELYHFFNTISIDSSPWIVSYETCLPRLGLTNEKINTFGIKKLASNNCKKIIAISDSAYQIQKQYLYDYYKNYYDEIMNKIEVILPPQRRLITTYEEKMLPSTKIVFTIVGNDFFRKGGKEILHVFDRLIPTHSELMLNIVSNLNFGDYATRTTVEDFNEAKKIIEKYSKNIFYYKNLPNEKVLELFKNSHVGLLPTWGDSFGYSVLESQAAGTPVISTNLRALPEINNGQIGWTIDVPKQISGDGLISTSNERLLFGQIIEENLSRIISDLYTNFHSIKIKGILALDNIQKRHCIDSHKNTLHNIYLNAIHS